MFYKKKKIFNAKLEKIKQIHEIINNAYVVQNIGPLIYLKNPRYEITEKLM